MANAEQKNEKKTSVISDSAFLLYAAAALAAITAVLVFLSYAFIRNVWMVGDTKLFFEMADLILKGGTPYVDFMDPKPPLIFFTLTIPAALGAKLSGGLLLVGLCNFASALLITIMAWKQYGRLPGLLAGVLFIVNMALAEGFFILTEPFTLTFILLFVYLMLFSGSRRKYFYAGISAGLAIGFKQYALLLMPLALFYMYRNKELKEAPSFFAGLALPLVIIFGAIFLLYGTGAGFSSLYWSFGVADAYFTQGYIGDIPAYMAPSPMVAAANVLLESGLFISLVVLAFAGVLLDRKFSVQDEFFIVSGVGFMSLLIVRQYLHYWALAIPFIVLLCVRAYRKNGPTLREQPSPRGDMLYAALAVPFFAFVIVVFIAIEYVLTTGLWRPFDILSYYGLADPAAKMITGMLDHASALPPLLFSLSPPFNIPWTYVLVGCVVLASACLVTLIGIRSYGLRAGLLAGLLFTVNIVWVSGYLSVADVLALAFVLLSVYFITGASTRLKYFAAGLCIGLAACLAPLVLIVMPVSLAITLKRKDAGRMMALLVGALLPVVMAATVAFILYGGAAPELAMAGGFSLASVYVSGTPYRTTDAIMAIANIVLAVCIFTSLLPMAMARFATVERVPADSYYVLAGLFFIGTALLKDYLHYWFIALPFLALLCAGIYCDKR